MIFSDTTTKAGLIQDCEQLCFGEYGAITGDTNRLYDFTNRINRAYDKLATKIMTIDGKWEFDDTSKTDYPIGTTDIVANQEDYPLDAQFLLISKVVMNNVDGTKTILEAKDINADEINDDIKTNAAGTPKYYFKLGGSVFLRPVPDTSITSGLTVYYKRPPTYFAYTDTTKTAGVPSVFDRYLSLDASLDYKIIKQHPDKNDIAIRLQEMDTLINTFYNIRGEDVKKTITFNIENNK